MNAIEVTHVTKIYRRYAQRRQFATLKSAILSGTMIRDLRPDETFPALRDVSFSVSAGRTYGIIGRNGSGKSTALKVVAGITKPTSGTVKVHGRISALIELGAGFHPEISGRENVYINGIMLGLSKREIARRFDEIVEFAELQDFIDAPVKTYSSGMYMRLGFAVAIHVDPGRAAGGRGAGRRRRGLHAQVPRQVRRVPAPRQDGAARHALARPGRAVLRRGAVAGRRRRRRPNGDPAPRGGHVRHRRRAVRGAAARARRRPARARRRRHRARAGEVGDRGAGQPPSTSAETPPDMFRATEGRWGSREVEISDVDAGRRGRTAGPRVPVGRAVTLEFDVKADAAGARTSCFGVGIFNAEGVCIYGTNTDLEQYQSGVALGRRAASSSSIEALDLVEGTYKLDVAVHKRDGVSVRLPPVALHVPREVARQGRGHLSAPAPVGVHPRDPLPPARGLSRDRAPPLQCRCHVRGFQVLRARTHESWLPPPAQSLVLQSLLRSAARRSGMLDPAPRVAGLTAPAKALFAAGVVRRVARWSSSWPPTATSSR